jgi:hexosaminidase
LSKSSDFSAGGICTRASAVEVRGVKDARSSMGAILTTVIAAFGFLLLSACMSGDVPSIGLTSGDSTPDVPQVIPLPMSVEFTSGAFVLQPSTTIAVPDSADGAFVGTWLAELLRTTTQMDLQSRAGSDDEKPASGLDTIVFEIGESPGNAGPEAYSLSVSPEGIVVTAKDSAGLFYGAVSLWQLATAGAREEQAAGGLAITIPALTVDDSPRFAWRGLMLDSARHYVSPPFIKRMIDWMALHKLNVLHWHLTDDQGWRLEIDAFPRLTEIGAWRMPAGQAALRDIDPASGKPRRYGGYYTKDEVRDIVAYAAKRHITIVPEIEMPGHAQAAIAAYPEFGADDAIPAVSSDWGIHDYLFDVDEDTLAALETILSEVLELFPGRYIHIGGDEAVKNRWIASERVQQRMRELGVANETELQSWFTKRIERFLQAKGRRLIGWDEILEGGIAPQATVMSWRGVDGAIEAALQGHDAVLTPWPTLYFDNRQSVLASEPPGRGFVVSLADVYRFEPMPPALADAAQRVLGIQANLWSEHMRTEERLAYMAFPRAAALAEVAWSQPERLDWSRFLQRLPTQFDRYRSLGIPFATSVFDVQAGAAAGDAGKGVDVELSNQAELGDILYTTDESPVTAESARYTAVLHLPADAELTAATFVNGKQVSRTMRGNVGRMARRRVSHELTLCSEKLVLALEDDAPPEGRSTFLIDVMNPCWTWEKADLSAVAGIKAAVGQVPFNFQLGADRDQIELLSPRTPAGELEVRAGGCDGDPVAVLALDRAARNTSVTVLSGEWSQPPPATTDLCFRFTAGELDPLWVIDWIELTPAENPP